MPEGGDQDTLTEGRPNQNPADAQKYGDPDDDAYENLLTLARPKPQPSTTGSGRASPGKPAAPARGVEGQQVAPRGPLSNVYVQKVQDKDLWQRGSRPTTAPPIPVLNKSDRLCRRLKNISFADPPVPEAVPSTDEDEDRKPPGWRSGSSRTSRARPTWTTSGRIAGPSTGPAPTAPASSATSSMTGAVAGSRSASWPNRAPSPLSLPFLGPNGEQLPVSRWPATSPADGTLQDTPRCRDPVDAGPQDGR
jgi:hypothetical protein